MKAALRKYYKDLIFAAVVIISLTLVSCALSLIDRYSTGLSEQTADLAYLYTQKAGNTVNDVLEDFRLQSVDIASNVKGCSDSETLTSYLHQREKDDEKANISLVYFTVGDKVFDSSGFDVSADIDNNLKSVIGSQKTKFSGIVYNNNKNSSYITCYVPIENGEYADGILVFFSQTVLLDSIKFDDSAQTNESEYTFLCTYDGRIIKTLYSMGELITETDNVPEKLRSLTNNKETVDKYGSILASEDGGAIVTEISNSPYAISVQCASLAGSSLYVVELYNAYDVYSEGYLLANTISAVVIILTVFLILSAAYYILTRSKVLNQSEDAGSRDPLLGCFTYNKFTSEAETVISRNKITKYALVNIEAPHMSYIQENFGDAVKDNVLRFINKVLGAAMLSDERYGYLGESKFIVLMHYRDVTELSNRLKVVSAIAYNCPELKENNYYLKLSFGVYCINRTEELTIQKMLDRASIALKSNLNPSNTNIVFFNDKIRNDYLHEAEIEAKMETSLANNEFKVFYQPKYNIKENRPDGSEALVRWYDPENNEFRRPAGFLPLFEANGFIAKLDRYVFAEVCKYISEAVSRGYKMYPVSVNVSRVTATQPGFTEYYIQTKKKYNIANGFITIEFTESFAFENYEVLKEIINTLHKNGFLCSIDDFGSGYSSYNVLKDLPMDEIKFDRFFIEKGISGERDDKLLKTMIELSKSLGMKVTQEGVESPDDLARLERFGCDVIQGYYYSKPLVLTDYIEFINNHGSISRLIYKDDKDSIDETDDYIDSK